MSRHVILACTQRHAIDAAEAWGWTRLPGLRNGFVTFEGPQGSAIALSNADALEGIEPDAIVFLGYHWQFAYNRNGIPHNHLTRHIGRGGLVIERQWPDVPWKTWPAGEPWTPPASEAEAEAA